MLKTSVNYFSKICETRVCNRWVDFNKFSTQTSASIREGEVPSSPKPTSDLPGFHNKYVWRNVFDTLIWNKGGINNTKWHIFWQKLFESFGPIIRLKFPSQRPFIGIYDPVEVGKVYQMTLKNPIREGFHALAEIRKNSIDNYFEGKAGIIAENNEEWWRVRSKAQKPLMDKNKLLNYLPAMDAVARDFMDRIALLQKENGEMPENFQQDLYRWALESVSLIVLDRRLGCLEPNLQPDSMPLKLIDSVNGFFDAMNDTEVSFHLWKYLPTPSFKRLERIHRQFLELADQAIGETEATLLMKSKNPDNKENMESLTLLETLLHTPGLSKKDVVTLILDMIFAGIDTSAYTLAFLLYLLARNPHCQKQLQDEVDSVLVGKDRSEPLTDADLSKMTYLKCCMKETMRMYPLVLGHVRVLEEDIVLHGYMIPKGNQVFCCNIMTTKDEKFFVRPKEFLPERWYRSRPHGEIHPYASIPFSHGLRMCIGRRIAEQEMFTFAARVMQRFTVDYKYQDMELLSKVMILTPAVPLRFSFTERVTAESRNV